MKLLVKQDQLYLAGHNNTVTERLGLTLDTSKYPRAEEYSFHISFNDGVYIPVEGPIKLPKELGNELNIKVRVIDKDSGYSSIVTMDTLPVTKAVILGESLANLYPEKIQELEKRIKRLEKAFVENHMIGEIL